AVEQLAYPAAGGNNVVNVTIVDFRGADTMLEIAVFGTAALGVANLVAAARGTRPEPGAAGRLGSESLIFNQTTRWVFHLTMLLSIYVLLRGHNAPGGGFAGGLIAGAGFVFRVLSGEVAERPRARLVVPPIMLIACGLLLAT